MMGKFMAWAFIIAVVLLAVLGGLQLMANVEVCRAYFPKLSLVSCLMSDKTAVREFSGDE